MKKFRAHVGKIVRDLGRQRGVGLLEGFLMSPKFGIAFVIGFKKGKSAFLIQVKFSTEASVRPPFLDQEELSH